MVKSDPVQFLNPLTEHNPLMGSYLLPQAQQTNQLASCEDQNSLAPVGCLDTNSRSSKCMKDPNAVLEKSQVCLIEC
jgi:hypothetical protein